MDISYTKFAGSSKSAHQQVLIDHAVEGEVWREQVNVVVSKFTEPRRTAVKWRWFAKKAGDSVTLGRGTRVAMLLGAGFNSKGEATEALIQALGPRTNR